MHHWDCRAAAVLLLPCTAIIGSGCGRGAAPVARERREPPSTVAATASASPPSPAALPPTVSEARHGGHLTALVCDVKRPLAGTAGHLDAANYATVLDALHTKLGCDVLRVYIDPERDDPKAYPPLYADVLARARTRLGMRIYANPLGTGHFGKAPATYARWIATYSNAIRPDFLGPFNESGLRGRELDDIARRVRAQLTTSTVLVGPDVQKVSGAMAQLREEGALARDFDVFASHDAVDDESATVAGWTTLASQVSVPLWASEDPRPLHATSPSGDEVGVAAVLAAPVAGLVLYEAYPSCVSDDGSLTAKGAALAAALRGG